MSLPAHRVQALFLGVALLFTGVLGWLGWRLLQQDRSLARQRRLEQLEAAADRVSSAIYSRLAELEETLSDPDNGRVPSAVVMLRARRDGIVVRPPNSLLYYPVLPVVAEAPPAVFAEAEAIEFQKNDPVAAAELLRSLAGSVNPVIRAGALLRLGRNLVKSGRSSEAMRAYGELACMGPATLGGLPADLLAAEARCSLLERLGRRSELKHEAEILYNKLAEGRWSLSRASYEFKIEEARVWGGVTANAQLEQRAALSAAAQALWNAWLQEPVGKGTRFLAVEGGPVLASWISSQEELTAVLAPAAALSPVLRASGEFQARFFDAEGRLVLGAPGPVPPIRVERSPSSTRLPWTLQVAAQDDGSAGLASRQWIFASGFFLLLILLGGTSYLAARATSKELAVARLQTDFVSAVSHEFRSPLSSICQISELLSEDRWPSDGHRRQGVEILGRESARLRRLVEGLLDFARIEAGAAHYRLEPLRPGDLACSTVEEFRMQLVARGHDIRVSVAPELPEINADREALGRALWNLLDNAVKYSPDSDVVQLEIATHDGNLAIRVRDHGIGIPAEEREEIFRKFVRGSQAKLRGMKGTGIGLTMVRHIVEGHNGSIHLDSEPGRGSTFTILLPTRRPT